MNGELSSQILVYLLTMVDMPKEGGGQLPIMEKMQKTHGCLAERLIFIIHYPFHWINKTYIYVHVVQIVPDFESFSDTAAEFWGRQN